MAEYVWIDGSNGIRSKSKVSAFQPFNHLSTIPSGILHVIPRGNLAQFAIPIAWLQRTNRLRSLRNTQSERHTHLFDCGSAWWLLV